MCTKEKESSLLDLKESATKVHKGVSDGSLMVDIEGIHSVLTKNFTYYTPKSLKESCNSEKWTRPYERPVIMHHNDEDGVIIGRIKKRKYVNRTEETDYPGIIFSANIPHKEGKEGVNDGRLLTTSIGVRAYDVRCSICGKNIAEEPCCHERGESYDGKICYWSVEKFEPKELSYVIVPSDQYAKNIKTYSAEEYNKKLLLAESENKEVNTVQFEELEKQLQAELDKKMTESQNVDENNEVELNEDGEVKQEEVKEEKPVEEPKEEPKKEDEKVDEEEPKSEDEKESDEDKEDSKEKDKKEETDKDKKANSYDMVKDLQKEILELEGQIIRLKQQLNIEKGLKESLESELDKLKLEKKNDLVEKANDLRQQLSLKEMEESFVKSCSLELLESTIDNYKEILGSGAVAKSIKTVESECIVDDKKDPNMKNMKKEENISNTSLEEDIKDFLKF